MEQKRFRALIVEEPTPGEFRRFLGEKSIAELPEGEVLIRVQYSDLNYKDALSARGHKGITRQYPHTPGIDAAGEVVESRVEQFRPGDPVIVTGYDLGMNTSGGFGQYIRVPAAWIVPLPAGLTLRESMILGTAGFTAAEAVFKMKQNGVSPEKGEVLVTGATGGVGSLGVALLSHLGFRVVAATGKINQEEFLKSLGAAEVLPREEVDDHSGKPLLPKRWQGVLDTVGGNVLSTVLRSTLHEASVVCVGNVASSELHTNVFPFILRGVTLFGVASATTPMPLRRKLWELLAGEWKIPGLDSLAREVSLEELNQEIDHILKGEQVGRVLVNLWK